MINQDNNDWKELEGAIYQAKHLIDGKLRECGRCKVYDLLPIIVAGKVFDWSSEPLVALFQKQFIIQSALIELQEDYRVLNQGDPSYIPDPEDARTLTLSSVDVALVDTVYGGEESDHMRSLEDAAAQVLLEHYRDYSRFFNATSENVASLLQLFWAQFSAYEAKDEAFMVLGVSADASWSEIQSTYRALVAQHHPDRGGEASHFIRIREAYEKLKDIYEN